MIPAAFDYAAPATLDDAIRILNDQPDEAKVLAGGHSLLPLMKLRLAAPGLLVDLGKVPSLSFVREDGESVAVGPMTTYYTLETSEVVRKRLPLLAMAAAMVGDPQVRNRGTVGGSLAHADPASDLPAIARALRADIVVQGPNGKRTIAADDFFLDIWTSALEPNELITEIRFPVKGGTRAQYYEKFRQRASDWAIVGVAVDLARDGGKISDASVVLTNVGPTPMRATGVEEALNGQEASADAIAAAAQKASDGLEPSAELKASPEYKLHLARVLTGRAIEAALKGTG